MTFLKPWPPLSFLFGPAYAAPKLKRISGKVVGAALAKAAKRIANEQVQNLPDVLVVVARQLRDTNFKKLREFIFSPGMFSATVGIATARGVNALKSFVKGKTNARHSPVTILATVAYLEWEAACGKAPDGQDNDAATPEQKAETQATLDTLECNGQGLRGGANRSELYRL